MSWWNKYSEGQVEQAIENALNGSSASLIHQASVTLDHDDFRQTPNTAVPFVGSPGAGLALIGDRATIVTDFSAGGYTNGADQSSLWIGTPDGIYIAYGMFARDDAAGVDSLNNLLVGADTTFLLGPSYSGLGAWYLQPYVVLVSAIADKAWSIKADNGGSNFSPGNASNSALFATTFLVFNLATGLYLTTTETGWNQTTRTFS